MGKAKMTIKDLHDLIMENFYDPKHHIVNISKLNFSKDDCDVDIGFMKVKGNLWQGYNEVRGDILQDGHEVGGNVYQSRHKVGGDVFQNWQTANGKVVQDDLKNHGIEMKDPEKNYEVYEIDVANSETHHLAWCSDIKVASAIAYSMANQSFAKVEYYVTCNAGPCEMVPGGGGYIRFQKNDDGNVTRTELS